MAHIYRIDVQKCVTYFICVLHDCLMLYILLISVKKKKKLENKSNSPFLYSYYLNLSPVFFNVRQSSIFFCESKKLDCFPVSIQSNKKSQIGEEKKSDSVK